jgi:hypothetical protein
LIARIGYLEYVLLSNNIINSGENKYIGTLALFVGLTHDKITTERHCKRESRIANGTLGEPPWPKP